MQILSATDGVITLSGNLLPLEPATRLTTGSHVSNNYETVSVYTIHSLTIQVWFIELTAHNNDTITISNEDTKAIVLQVVLKNTLTVSGSALHERHFSIAHYPDNRFNFQTETGKTYTLALIYIPLELLQQLNASYPPLTAFINAVTQGKKAKVTERNRVASSLLLLSLIECKYCKTLNELEANARCLLTVALNVTYNPASKSKHITVKQLEQLYKLTSFINNNYQKQYSTLEYIKKAKASKHVVKNHFTSFYNVVITDYIDEIRIIAAIRLLLTTKNKIETVAFEVGYTYKTFDRMFKKFMGVSPYEYRKKKQTN